MAQIKELYGRVALLKRKKSGALIRRLMLVGQFFDVAFHTFMLFFLAVSDK